MIYGANLPTDIRKVIYTTNVIESLNSMIRHVIRCSRRMAL
ncbi:transposase [Salmonella enterica]|nr:transposase [Salmonella enterica]